MIRELQDLPGTKRITESGGAEGYALAKPNRTHNLKKRLKAHRDRPPPSAVTLSIEKLKPAGNIEPQAKHFIFLSTTDYRYYLVRITTLLSTIVHGSHRIGEGVPDCTL